MPANRKKSVNAGAGRPRGSRDRATIRAREAIVAFLRMVKPKAERWIEAVALLDPDEAALMRARLARYDF